MNRRKAKELRIGNIFIGGDHPVAVQSMLNTPAADIAGCVRQARALEAAGCQILRAAVPDKESVKLIAALKEHTAMPIVADIHFDYRLAIECAAAGADKIRVNPGNIGGAGRVRQVANACGNRGIPIRVGVNAGSLEKELLAKYGGPTAAALVESALNQAALLERFDFSDIVLSLKASSVRLTVEAYELAAAACDYPLHLGVTEAGTSRRGIVKSSVGIGALLLRGIGDTLRVSLTDEPVREIEAGYDILRAAGLYTYGSEVIACPTCGRTKIDVIALANEVERHLAGCEKALKVAVMGCAVNGPGEAREADIGIAGGDGNALLFKKGEIVRKIPEAGIVEALLEEIESL